MIGLLLYISLAKLIAMMFGCGGAIISNSSFYQISLVFSIVMAFGVSILNMIWIPLYGIDGAALATLVVVGVSIVIKIIYLQFKIRAHPLSWNLFKALVAVGILYTLFQYIDWTFSPIVQIVLTSVLVSALYLLIVAQFKLSDDLLRLVKRIGK